MAGPQAVGALTGVALFRNVILGSLTTGAVLARYPVQSLLMGSWVVGNVNRVVPGFSDVVGKVVGDQLGVIVQGGSDVATAGVEKSLDKVANSVVRLGTHTIAAAGKASVEALCNNLVAKPTNVSSPLTDLFQDWKKSPSTGDFVGDSIGISGRAVKVLTAMGVGAYSSYQGYSWYQSTGHEWHAKMAKQLADWKAHLVAQPVLVVPVKS